MIRVYNLCKKYGKVTVMKNISFCIDDEEIVAITGESGKGKTTLLNLISCNLKSILTKKFFRDMTGY